VLVGKVLAVLQQAQLGVNGAATAHNACSSSSSSMK
jgi:hypothetical protein